MEDKIFDFAKTRDALGELSADLIEMESALKVKQNRLIADKQKKLDEINEKNQKIAELTKACEEALMQIENINNCIEEVL